jgi:hypothetical protein
MRWFHLIQATKLQQHIQETGRVEYEELDDPQEIREARSSLNRRSKNNEASVSKKRRLKRWQASHYPFVILMVSLVECALSGLKIYFECQDIEPSDPGYIAVEVLYLLLILLIVLFAVPVFLYSAKFFPGLYQEQLEIAARAVDRHRLNTMSNIVVEIRDDDGTVIAS